MGLSLIHIYYDFDYIAGVESRGLIFGAPLADRLNKGFIPIRKPGKLPAEIEKVSYDLEYGTNELEIHKDALNAVSYTHLTAKLTPSTG